MYKIIKMMAACTIVSIGVSFLQASSLVTGGTAGLSLGLSYVFSVPFSIMFFLLNIPFYVLAMIQMGVRFTVSTITAVSMLSVLNGLLQTLPSFSLHPFVGALGGGLLIGFGLVILFLNGSSLGGANILALYLQKRLALDPGKTNFVFDVCVVLTGFYSTGLTKGLYSILSIFVISVIISYAKERIAMRSEERNKSVA